MGKQVHQPGTTYTLRFNPSDGLTVNTAFCDLHRFHRPVVAGHSVGYLAALESRACGTGRGHKPVAVAHDNLGVGAHVNQHNYVFLPVDGDGQQIGGYVGSNVAADQWPAVYIGFRMNSESQLSGLYVQRRGLSQSLLGLQFSNRFVRLLADGLHVQAEEHVTHGGIGHHHCLVYAPPVDAQQPGHVSYFEVDGRQHHLLELPPVRPAVIGDAVHHVASAELLGILEGRGVGNAAGFQVDQVHHYRGCADIDGQAVDAVLIPFYAPAVKSDVAAHPHRHRFNFHVPVGRVSKNPRLAPQGYELDVHRGIDDAGLAGKAVVPAQERLCLSRGTQSIQAATNLHDALMTIAHSSTGCGNPDSDVVSVIEDCAAGCKRYGLPGVMQGRHSLVKRPRRCGSRGRHCPDIRAALPRQWGGTGCGNRNRRCTGLARSCKGTATRKHGWRYR